LAVCVSRGCRTAAAPHGCGAAEPGTRHTRENAKMARKTAMTRFAGWGRLAALALVAAAAWSQAGAAQEEDRENVRIVRYYQDPQPMLGVYVEAFGQSGLRVTRVTEDWPAEGAGIRKDDVIVRIDGHELAEPLEDEAERGLPSGGSLRERRLRALLREVPEGEAVEVTVRRDGETRTFTVVPKVQVRERAWPALARVGVWPDSLVLLEHSERFRDQYERAREGLEIRDGFLLPSRSYRYWWDGTRWEGGHGLDLLELNPELGSYFGTEVGVLVADVDDDSTLGLRPGDVVVGIDGRPVADIARLHRILASYEEEEEIRFRIWRDGAETTAAGTIS